MVVRVSRTLLGASVVVTATGVLLLSIVAPTVVDGDGEDSVALFVNGALCAYKNENAQVPANFVDVLPFLKSITRDDCSIEKLSGDRYHVRLYALHRAYDIEIQYLGDPDTGREEYHVIDIRHHPIGNTRSSRAK